MTSSVRLILSIVFPLIVFYRAFKKRSVNLSGALSGFFVCLLLALANSCFALSLITFFVTSSIATKYRQEVKAKIEENFKKDGQRSWVQVVCNGGAATILGVLYLLEVGSEDMPIDFVNNYKASWLSTGIMSIFAFGNADTWASELGTVLAKSKPRLITTWRRVPTGTNGGITPIGTLLSTLGGLVVGVSYYIGLLIFVDSAELDNAPSQYPILIFGALAGLIGSLLDSLIGATMQYSGVNDDRKIVSDPKFSCKHISGSHLLSNHNVNLVVTILIGVLMPFICSICWFP